MVRNFSFAKKIMAMTLCICLLCSVIGVIPASAQETDGVTPVSKIVQGEDGAYIEYLGKPYLMYGIQMRLDWAYTDKGGDETFIAENFERVVADGFKSVAIPIYWSQIETEDGVFDFSRLEMYYKYINQYDLTVQWLWFGTNVCGSAGEMPVFIKNDTATYKRVYAPNSPTGVYIDFSCEETLTREKQALAKMMEWLSVNDTDKRCVMIQVNNEVDQSGNNFDPYYSAGLSDAAKKALVGKRWYENAESHDAYCWAGGQREAVLQHLSDLGDIIHESDYSVVTRVNFSGAGRHIPEIEDDLTDLLALGGIDIVGEDIYSTTWSDITRTFNIIDGNVNHLAENGGSYDSSYNVAKTFELGGGLIIYSHREDREANGGSGIYKNTQGETPDNANRAYREWVERDTTQAVRNFAKTVGKVYQPLANAVANRNFVEFNGDKADTFTATKTVGDMDITYTAENNGLGMAFEVENGRYIINATDAAQFTFDTAVPLTVQSGYYDGEEWVADDGVIAVDGNNVTLTAGQIALVDTNVYYEFMGQQVAFDLPDGVEVTTDANLNGKTVLKNTTEDRKTFTLAENLQDFKISYRFQNGSGWGSSGTLAPVLVKMRGRYNFANLYYNPNGDLLFGGGGETTRHKVSGGTTGWHTAEIIMKDDRMVIIYDGIVWDSRTLVQGATSGELQISLKYIGTEITDLKVESVTDDDLNLLVNGDFSEGAKQAFPVAGAYDYEEGALAITNQWNEYKFDGPNNFDDKNYATVENYVLEMEFRLDGITTSAYQRGAEIHLPSGYSVGLFGSEVRTALRENLTGKSSSYFIGRSLNLMDGNYHTLKVISKYGTEQIIIDGTILKTYEITERVSGNISWKNNKQEGTTYLRMLKIYNDTSAERAIYSEPVVDVSQRNSSNRVYTRTHATVINEDAWVFSARFKVVDIDAHAANQLLWFRIKSTNSGGKDAVELCIDKTQYYFGGANYGLKTVTDDNGYVPHTVKSDTWVDVRVAIIGNYVIVTIDGKTDVWYANIGIKPDSGTSDHIQFFPSTSDTVSIEENVVVADVKYEYASELEGVIVAADAIGEVTADSSALIFAAEDSLEILNDSHLAELAYFTGKIDAAYNTYDALFEDGDVTEDGNVDIIDLIRVKKIAAGGADKTIKANVDKDNERIIGATDASALRKILLAK